MTFNSEEQRSRGSEEWNCASLRNDRRATNASGRGRVPRKRKLRVLMISSARQWQRQLAASRNLITIATDGANWRGLDAAPTCDSMGVLVEVCSINNEGYPGLVKINGYEGLKEDVSRWTFAVLKRLKFDMVTWAKNLHECRKVCLSAGVLYLTTFELLLLLRSYIIRKNLFWLLL